MFTDYYAEQSCTAGRASFITGQSGLRTGMTKVGLPGAALGVQAEDITEGSRSAALVRELLARQQHAAQLLEHNWQLRQELSSVFLPILSLSDRLLPSRVARWT